MTHPSLSLRTIITLLIVAAFASGGLTSWIWVQSTAAWRAHKDTAQTAGVLLYGALQDGAMLSPGVVVSLLSPADDARAATGAFRQVTAAPAAARITVVPILPDIGETRTGRDLTLVILSPDLIYPIAGLPPRGQTGAAQVTGEVFRLLASYCSDPLVLAQLGDGAWMRIDGGAVWNCDTAPADYRLPAAGGLILALAILIGAGQTTSAHFTNFARQLQQRRRLDGPRSYDTPGPRELQDIVAAVNAHLAAERSQLESRAAVLSGVSHDLGTPATRLRLRAALIEDPELRNRLESDIDSMTGMIESILTYTRAEMNAEEPRDLSLSSLIDAIVADYQDTGRAVRRRQDQELIVEGGQSVFMPRRGRGIVVADRQIIVLARPISLERAVCNLVNNALKYGRRATVGLEADADTATIIVDDEGSLMSAGQIEALTAPFRRGDNTAKIEGYGLGLTIVATIAALHGGGLEFEDTAEGLRARLTIQRR